MSNTFASNQANYTSNQDKVSNTTIYDPLIANKTSSTITYQQITQLQDQQISHNNKSHFILAISEARSITKLALPFILIGLVVYSRSMISMLFLGQIGDLALAGGSLAIGFANITGYSVLSGLAMGMEPICGQAFGAKRYKLLGLVMQKTILLLLLTSIPISFLWLNMKKILLFFHQDKNIANEAQSYIVFSLPDLIIQSILHPIRIYLRSQSITLPLTYCAAVAILLHMPITYFLVVYLNLGVKGVAISGVVTNFNLVASLIIYIIFSKMYTKTWCAISLDCIKGWKTLVNLAIPSCISVCLEWWWYEIMILLCGLLSNPQTTIASMGILIQTTALLYIFPSSLSLSVSTRVGNALGANQPKRAKDSTIIGLFFGLILGFSSLLFTMIVRKIWASFFTKDVEIIALTSKVLPIIGFCELGNCPQTTSCGVLRGLARPKFGATVNLGSFYLMGMPIALWLAFKLGFGFNGLWLGLLTAQGTCMLAMLLVLIGTNWKVQAQKAQELTLDVNVEGDACGFVK